MARHIVKVTTTGSAGSASGSALSAIPIKGYLEAITVVYASQPATTDVTIAESGGAGRTLLTLTNGNTNTTKYPRPQAHDGTGTAITGEYTRVYVPGDYVSVSVAQGDAATNAVTVYLDVVEG